MKLTRVKYGALIDLDGVQAEAFLQGRDNPAFFDMTDRWLFKLRALVTAETLEDVTLEWPADWWQAVRERWLPRLWLKRWPVKMKRYQVTAYKLYPRISLPDELGAVVTLVSTMHDADREPD